MTDANDAEYGLSRVEKAQQIVAPTLNYLPLPASSNAPKIGLIGAGGISEYHLRAYRTMGLEVVAICDVDRERAEARRDEFYPNAAVCDHYHDVLAIDEVGLIDAATHPDPRVAIVEAAIHAGKHVLSQKPFVKNLDDGERLVQLAESHGVQLAVNQNGRWAPHFRYLLCAVREQLIGPVGSVDFTLQWDHTWTIETPFNEIHHLILYDFAIHWFDMATALLDPQSAERVYASIKRSSFQRAKPPFLAQVAIDFSDAQVRMGFNAEVQHGQEDRTVVAGRDGTLRAYGPSLNDQTVELTTSHGSARPTLEGCWFDNGFQGTMAELLDAIETGREPENSARRNLASLGLCFAAIASANTGHPVECGSVRQLPDS